MYCWCLKVFNGLKDVVDDVVSEAAGALLPVVKQFIDSIDVVELSEPVSYTHLTLPTNREV